MTPLERSRFIEAQLRCFGNGIEKNIEFIAAQIEEAEQEAYERGWRGSEARRFGWMNWE